MVADGGSSRFNGGWQAAAASMTVGEPHSNGFDGGGNGEWRWEAGGGGFDDGRRARWQRLRRLRLASDAGKWVPTAAAASMTVGEPHSNGFDGGGNGEWRWEAGGGGFDDGRRARWQRLRRLRLASDAGKWVPTVGIR
uniref:DUF834 domain-containing protein n=1 Tax=Oryza punctata TaxID=4537 RepID=A0A0E0KGT7_ORYPU